MVPSLGCALFWAQVSCYSTQRAENNVTFLIEFGAWEDVDLGLAKLPWKPIVAYDHADYFNLLSATDVRRQNEARVVCPAECLTPALTDLTHGPDHWQHDVPTPRPDRSSSECLISRKKYILLEAI